MPVSELEKNPDKRMSAASTEKRRPSGASFKLFVKPFCGMRRYLEEKTRWRQARYRLSAAFQDEFEYGLGAKVAEHQQGEARQSEAHGGLAAPA